MPSFIDITPPITPDLCVFPGDTPPSRETLLDMERGDHITLSTLHTTVHLGAHVDGPVHYGAGEPGVDAIPLDRFIGPCQVMHVSCGQGNRIRIDELSGPITAPRLLLRTGTFPDPTQWCETFAGLTPELVDFLADAGVALLGIDTPSVDPATERALSAHHRFLARDVTILEGIVLDDVPEGAYELFALPLRLVGYDGSPVRAVLRTLPAEDHA